MVHAGCVFVTGIHLSRTWMSGSFESVRWNACVHRLDLGLYSHPKGFLGHGVRTHVNSKGKILATGDSEEVRTCDAVLCRTVSPAHYRLSYSGPGPRGTYCMLLGCWGARRQHQVFTVTDMACVDSSLTRLTGTFLLAGHNRAMCGLVLSRCA